jgi:hypothetical protein
MIETKTVYGSKVHIYRVGNLDHKIPTIWVKCNYGTHKEYSTHLDPVDLRRPKPLKVKEQTSENMRLWNQLEQIPFADEYVSKTQIGDETLIEVKKENKEDHSDKGE